MKSIRMLVCCVSLIAGSTGIASAADAPTDATSYKQKMHDCATQMKTDHPDMNHDARRKACRKQLGPAPKAAAAGTTATPPPAPAN
jgi:hypothetical protein